MADDKTVRNLRLTLQFNTSPEFEREIRTYGNQLLQRCFVRKSFSAVASIIISGLKSETQRCGAKAGVQGKVPVANAPRKIGMFGPEARHIGSKRGRPRNGEATVQLRGEYGVTPELSRARHGADYPLWRCSTSRLANVLLAWPRQRWGPSGSLPSRPPTPGQDQRKEAVPLPPARRHRTAHASLMEHDAMSAPPAGW